MVKKKKLTRKEAKTLHVKYSWLILEHKFRYYEGQKYNLKTIPDEKYDKLEARYKKLSNMLNLPTSASDMVGFDISRPSCKLVFRKLTGENK